MFVDRQRLGKQVSAAIDIHATIGESASMQRNSKNNNRGIIGNGVFWLVRAEWL
jgi:hypothetical protein